MPARRSAIPASGSTMSVVHSTGRCRSPPASATLNKPPINMALGRVLGGGSSASTRWCGRAARKRDYDIMGTQRCHPGWAFKDVLPRSRPRRTGKAAQRLARGKGGPVHIRTPGDPHPTRPGVPRSRPANGLSHHRRYERPHAGGAGYINMYIAADGSTGQLGARFPAAESWVVQPHPAVEHPPRRDILFDGGPCQGSRDRQWRGRADRPRRRAR